MTVTVFLNFAHKMWNRLTQLQIMAKLYGMYENFLPLLFNPIPRTLSNTFLSSINPNL